LRIFGPKKDENKGVEKNCTVKNLMICNAHWILFGWLNQEEWDGQGM
jgi:hypothetical protein